MTDSNSFLAPLQAEIAELRKRVEMLEGSHPGSAQPSPIEDTRAFITRIVATLEDMDCESAQTEAWLEGQFSRRDSAIRADERRKLTGQIDQLRSQVAEDIAAATRDLRAKLEAAERERDECKEALAEVHRVTGRGDGHGSPKETAGCIISACVDRQIELLESLDDRDQLRAELDRAQAVVEAAQNLVDAGTSFADESHHRNYYALRDAVSDLRAYDAGKQLDPKKRVVQP